MLRWIAWFGLASTLIVPLDPRANDSPSAGILASEPLSGPPLFAFNGKDLSGFYTFTRFQKLEDPAKVFSVKDGMIRISGEELGGLTTRADYSDYHLIVEWKWAGPTHYPRRWLARNSGVLVHGSGPDGDAFAGFLHSIECQILEGGTGDLIMVGGKGKTPPRLVAPVRLGSDHQRYFQAGGSPSEHLGGVIRWWGHDPDWRDVLWFRGANDLDRPVGDWNRMEIVCDGDSVACWLNGTLVNHAVGSNLNSGKILLESEGAEILFRKFEIRPLLKPGGPVARHRGPTVVR